MQKITTINLKIALIVLTILNVFSCSQDDDLSNLSDTIFVRHKNADMPAYIYGNGSEKIFLITLHGGPGGLGLSFRGTAFDQIEKSCAVVYFDQRGSGMAQGSFSEDQVTIDIMAEDILALVKVMKRKYGNDSRFFLLGHSWGGTLGIATLLKNQNEFLGWIQVDGTHSPKDLYTVSISNFERVASEQIAMGNSVLFWESVQHLVLDVEPSFNKNDITRLNNKAFRSEATLASDGVTYRENPSDNTFLEYNLLTAYWNAGNIQALIDPDIQGILSYTNRLTEIQIPSLILWGKHDMVVPPAVAQEAYDNLGSNIKELVIFERSGHAPFLSETNLFAEELLLFINQNK